MKFMLEGTVPTGFEFIGLEEVQEKLNLTGKCAQGRVFFEVQSFEDLRKSLTFASFEYVNVVVLKTKDITFSKDRNEYEKQLRNLVQHTSWLDGLTAWEACYGELPGSLTKVTHKLQKYIENLSERKIYPSDDIDVEGPRFRVTCHREGKDLFKFTSMEAAAFYGGEIHNCLRWKADMEKFNVEIILRINKDEIVASIPLVDHCLSFRNLIERGPTCLKGTVCYGLLRLCKLQGGDVVCDPMVGSGAILLEACRHWPICYYIGGDLWSSAPNKCLKNKHYLDSILNDSNGNLCNIELFAWDATKLPLMNSSVDCFVSDLPFGKRIGTQMDNRKLYPRLLMEMARVARPTVGRAILLTYDRRSLVQSLAKMEKFFTLKHSFVVNVGGLFSGVFILQRSATVL